MNSTTLTRLFASRARRVFGNLMKDHHCVPKHRLEFLAGIIPKSLTARGYFILPGQGSILEVCPNLKGNIIFICWCTPTATARLLLTTISVLAKLGAGGAYLMHSRWLSDARAYYLFHLKMQCINSWKRKFSNNLDSQHVVGTSSTVGI